MVILGGGPEADLAVAPAHRRQRELALEGHEALEDQRLAAEGRPRGVELAGRAHDDLPLSVVAEAARLEDDGETNVSDGALELEARADLGEGRGLDPELAKEALLEQAIARDDEGRGRRVDRRRDRRAAPTASLGTFSNS